MARGSNALAASLGAPPRTTTRPKRRKTSASTFAWDRMVTDLGKRDSRTARVAYYLDWAAKNLPMEYQPYNVIVQAINNYQRLPRTDHDEVTAIRTNMHTVRKVLQAQYERDLDSAGRATRATVNDEDAAAVVIPKKMQRLRAAKNALLVSHSLIDPKKVTDGRIRAYLTHSVKDIVRMVGSEEFESKLLPPSSVDE